MAAVTKNEIMQIEESAEEQHRLIIRKYEKRKLHSSFKDNIWDPNLADMQLLSKFDNGIHFLLCFIDIYSKYPWLFL